MSTRITQHRARDWKAPLRGVQHERLRVHDKLGGFFFLLLPLLFRRFLDGILCKTISRADKPGTSGANPRCNTRKTANANAKSHGESPGFYKAPRARVLSRRFRYTSFVERRNPKRATRGRLRVSVV